MNVVVVAQMAKIMAPQRSQFHNAQHKQTKLIWNETETQR